MSFETGPRRLGVRLAGRRSWRSAARGMATGTRPSDPTSVSCESSVSGIGDNRMLFVAAATLALGFAVSNATCGGGASKIHGSASSPITPPSRPANAPPDLGYTAERQSAHPENRLVHGLAVRGHALVWDELIPAWVRHRHWTHVLLAGMSQRYIMTVVGRYRRRIQDWAAVNEPLTNRGGPRPSLWERVIGPGYIALAPVRGAPRRSIGAPLHRRRRPWLARFEGAGDARTRASAPRRPCAH